MTDHPHPRPTLHKRQGGILSLSGPALLDLLRAVLDRGVPFRFTAPGFSMWPFIKDGDVITVSSITPSAIRLGDVVAFVNPCNERLTVHRVIRFSREAWLIKGDNSSEPDGWIPGFRILGRVIRVERRGHMVRFGTGAEAPAIAALARHNWLLSIFALWNSLRHIAGKLLRCMGLYQPGSSVQEGQIQTKTGDIK